MTTPKVQRRLRRMHPRITDYLKLQGLTPNERSVVGEVLKGQKHKISADELDTTEKNIKWHLTKIYKKLEVTSKSQMIVLLRDIQTKYLGEQ